MSVERERLSMSDIIEKYATLAVELGCVHALCSNRA